MVPHTMEILPPSRFPTQPNCTHNGSVIYRRISGDTQLKTHNGNIKVFYSEAAPLVCDISLITYNGGIELATLSNFSSEFNASTHNGSMYRKFETILLAPGGLNGCIDRKIKSNVLLRLDEIVDAR